MSWLLHLSPGIRLACGHVEQSLDTMSKIKDKPPGAVTRRFRTSPQRPLEMLAACPVYAPTPMQTIDASAVHPDLSAVVCKDETARMRLGSFKALGGVFAVAQMICALAETSDPMSDAAQACAKKISFVTASAGNHGLSVAAGARIFGARAVIVLDASVSEDFADRIRAAGARVERIAGSYEDAVAFAKTMAEDPDYLLLADGSWPGYIDPPALVMEGYSVLAEECRQSFTASGEWPDHVLLQAGVGGLAAAIAAHIRTSWPVQPVITVVEPDQAACLRDSVAAGQLVRAQGKGSNMGRLDCKDASLIAFEALRHDADHFVTVTDDEAAAAAELFDQFGIATTPSGAAPLAALVNGHGGKGARCMIIASEGRPKIAVGS